MTCSLILAATLALAALPETAGSQAPEAAVATSAPLTQEAFYADLIKRSQDLKAAVQGMMASPAVAQPDFAKAEPWMSFKPQAEDLARLDMQGHEDLKARNLDGDLKCILRGISEDMPKRLAAVEAAGTEAERKQALDELAYLLNDNAEVILAPPHPDAAD